MFFVVAYLKPKTYSDKIRKKTLYLPGPVNFMHLLHAGEENMKIYYPKCIIFPEPVCYKCFIIPNETKKTHICKILWQAYSKFIRTLYQTFKNHIHNKWCVPSASDVFLSKNNDSGGKTREASKGVEYDFYFTEYDFWPVWSRVLILTHCPIKLLYLC